MADPVRDACVRLLLDVEKQIPLSGPLEVAQSRLEPAARARLRSLVTEAVRHRARIDHVVSGFLSKGSVSSLHPPIRQILRAAGAEHLVLQSTSPHALVNGWVEIARRYGHKGTAGLVNAVLRRLTREGAAKWAAIESADAHGKGRAFRTLAQHWSILYSHPAWLVERWIGAWGEDRVRAILEWNQRTPDYWLRLAPGVAPGSDVLPEGHEAGWIPGAVRVEAGSRPHEEAAFGEGGYTVQDGSGIVVGLLAPDPHGLVLDLCAAPGTKTGHLLERGGERIRVLAADRSPGRLRRMRRGLQRLGREHQVHLVACDGRVPGWGTAPFSGALVDAPCTNLGVVRRRPDVRWRVTEDEVDRLRAVQAGLLDAAAAGVAPGGWLVYSVCTIDPAETLEQRAAFLSRNPGFRPVPLPEWVPAGARRDEGEMLLLPGEFETDGGYAFVMRKDAR